MADPELGPTTFGREGAMVTASLTRWLEASPDEVWAALSTPERLVQWLAPGSIDLRVGGAVRLDFGDSGIVIDSAVTAVTPLERLEYSWSGPSDPSRPIRWRLEPRDGGVELTLTLILPPDDDVGRSAAGWAAHLEMLACALAGAPIAFPFERFKATREVYRGQVASQASA